jgi:large subunit ribosomal protein L28
MPKACDICGKGPLIGLSRSHSNRATRKKWKPNLQHIKARTDKGPRKIWVCTRCLRSGRAVKIL